MTTHPDTTRIDTTHTDTTHTDTAHRGPDAATKEDAAVARVVQRMQSRFRDTNPDRVRDVVRSHQHRFDAARIRTYVPVLVEHAARTTLTTPGLPAPSPISHP